MTNREAIKLLKTILGTVCLGNQKFIDAVKKAIAALEKQIPKRNLEKCQYNENLLTLRCPTCGAKMKGEQE